MFWVCPCKKSDTILSTLSAENNFDFENWVRRTDWVRAAEGASTGIMSDKLRTPNQRIWYCAKIFGIVGSFLLVADFISVMLNGNQAAALGQCAHQCTLKPIYSSSQFSTKDKRAHEPQKEAYYTMVSSDKGVGPYGLSYADAAAVLVYSMRKAGSTRPFIVMLDKDIGHKSRSLFQALNMTTMDIAAIAPPKNRNVFYNPRMYSSFTKLIGWSLEECVFVFPLFFFIHFIFRI
jgi:hypothetical protein